MADSESMFIETLDRLTQAHEKIGQMMRNDLFIETTEKQLRTARNEIDILTARVTVAENHRDRVERLWQKAQDAADFMSRFSSLTEDDRQLLTALRAALENTKDYDPIPF